MLDNYEELQDAVESDAQQERYCCMLKTVTSTQYRECLGMAKGPGFG